MAVLVFVFPPRPPPHVLRKSGPPRHSRSLSLSQSPGVWVPEKKRKERRNEPRSLEGDHVRHTCCRGFGGESTISSLLIIRVVSIALTVTRSQNSFIGVRGTQGKQQMQRKNRETQPHTHTHTHNLKKEEGRRRNTQQLTRPLRRAPQPGKAGEVHPTEQQREQTKDEQRWRSPGRGFL